MYGPLSEDAVVLARDKQIIKYTKSEHREFLAETEAGETIWVSGSTEYGEDCLNWRYLGDSRTTCEYAVEEYDIGTSKKRKYKVVLDEESEMNSIDYYLLSHSVDAETLGNHFEIVDGVLFKCFSRKENIVIPEGVTKIANCAFEYCRPFKSVVLPSTVTKIPCAFCNTEQLEIAKDNPKYYIQDGCLIDKEEKELVWAFAGSTIPDDGSVVKIGSDAFRHRYDLSKIVVPDVITEICAYPYDNESITTQVLEILRGLVVENLGWEQYRHSEMTQWDSEYVVNPYDNQDNHLVFCSHAMYNDFRFIHKCFLPHTESKWTNRYETINYSGLSECLWCGNSSEHWEDLFDHEGCLIGDCCDNSFTCFICGERHNYDPQYLDGEPVCDYCLDNYVRECVICGELKHEDNLEVIYLGSVKGEWISVEFDSIFVCADHLKQALERYAKEDCQFYYLEQPWNKYMFIDIEDLSDEGQRHFFYDVDESNVEYVPNRHSRWEGKVISY